MSVIIRLGPSVGYGDLNHHDIDNSGGLDIGHARHAGRRGQLLEVMIFQVLEGTISTPGTSQGRGLMEPPFWIQKKKKEERNNNNINKSINHLKIIISPLNTRKRTQQESRALHASAHSKPLEPSVFNFEVFWSIQF